MAFLLLDSKTCSFVITDNHNVETNLIKNGSRYTVSKMVLSQLFLQHWFRSDSTSK